MNVTTIDIRQIFLRINLVYSKKIIFMVFIHYVSAQIYYHQTYDTHYIYDFLYYWYRNRCICVECKRQSCCLKYPYSFIHVFWITINCKYHGKFSDLPWIDWKSRNIELKDWSGFSNVGCDAFPSHDPESWIYCMSRK